MWFGKYANGSNQQVLTIQLSKTKYRLLEQLAQSRILELR